jgi:hypothetical protein
METRNGLSHIDFCFVISGGMKCRENQWWGVAVLFISLYNGSWFFLCTHYSSQVMLTKRTG